jgi:hypothetical protein
MSRQHKPEQDAPEWPDSIGLPCDTTPEAMAKEFEILRRISPADKLAMVFELSDNLRELVRAGVRYRNPDWDEARVNTEVARIWLGDGLYNEVVASGRIFR